MIERETPVSYTHLDVYKRQGMFGLKEVQDDLVKELQKLVDEEGLKLACLLVTDIVTHDSMPVSYTHLDVYKRQSLTPACSVHPCHD